MSGKYFRPETLEEAMGILHEYKSDVVNKGLMKNRKCLKCGGNLRLKT